MNTAEEIEQQFRQAQIENLPPGAFHHFSQYLELLLRWNARMNLTSARKPGEIIQRHFVECAFIAQNLPGNIATLLDFGSGAGFPGIPIAICRPDLEITLAESQNKKAAFLAEVVRTLNLPAEIYAQRVESLPGERRFDIVALRAVDKMEVAVPAAALRARRYLVVLGSGSAVHYPAWAPDFSWSSPLPLPAPSKSCLWMGERR
jgi:16S rRNA (guanine527-N7)-methyltransferase